MDIELIKKAINKAFDKHLTEVDNWNDAVFDNDRPEFIEDVVKNICDSQCCVTHPSKETQALDIAHSKGEAFNFEVSQLQK